MPRNTKILHSFRNLTRTGTLKPNDTTINASISSSLFINFISNMEKRQDLQEKKQVIGKKARESRKREEENWQRQRRVQKETVRTSQYLSLVDLQDLLDLQISSQHKKQPTPKIKDGYSHLVCYFSTKTAVLHLARSSTKISDISYILKSLTYNSHIHVNETFKW